MEIGYFKDYQIGIPGEKYMEKSKEICECFDPKDSVFRMNVTIQTLKGWVIIGNQKSKASVQMLREEQENMAS